MKGENCGPGVQLHRGELIRDLAEGQPDLQEDRVHHAGAVKEQNRGSSSENCMKQFSFGSFIP